MKTLVTVLYNDWDPNLQQEICPVLFDLSQDRVLDAIVLMLANGTPMFCAGDEFLNTQRGNNNPYNQDNETTWLDWSLLEKNRDMFHFFQHMIAFRKARPWIGRSRYWREDVHWYGAEGPVDLGSHTLAYCLRGERQLYVMINAFWEPVAFRIREGKDWRRLVDTSQNDLVEEPMGSLIYNLEPRSIAVLESRSEYDTTEG